MFSFDVKREPENHQRFRRAGPDGLRYPASTSCLGRHSCPADRGPNSSSLFPPQAAVVAVAHFSHFSDLRLRRWCYVSAKLYVLQGRKVCCEAANWRNEKKVQQRRPPPVAEIGRSCWGRGQQDASSSEADAGSRNPALASEARLRGCTKGSLTVSHCWAQPLRQR